MSTGASCERRSARTIVGKFSAKERSMKVRKCLKNSMCVVVLGFRLRGSSPSSRPAEMLESSVRRLQLNTSSYFYWVIEWSRRSIGLRERSSLEYLVGDSSQTITLTAASEGNTVKFGDLAAHGTLETYCRYAKAVTKNGTALWEGADYQYDSPQQMLSVPFAGATTISITSAESLFGQ